MTILSRKPTQLSLPLSLAHKRAACASVGFTTLGRALELEAVATANDIPENCVVAIDPGAAGAIVAWNGERALFAALPLIDPSASPKEIHFAGVCAILETIMPRHIFLERAVSFGMGIKGAFNYGRSFAALEIAIRMGQFPVTYVEPAKWTKEMLAGTDANLKPKVRSLAAYKRLFPQFVELTPRTGVTKRNPEGKLHEGVIDALLMAEYGRRKMNNTPAPATVDDF